MFYINWAMVKLVSLYLVSLKVTASKNLSPTLRTYLHLILQSDVWTLKVPEVVVFRQKTQGSPLWAERGIVSEAY